MRYSQVASTEMTLGAKIIEDRSVYFPIPGESSR